MITLFDLLKNYGIPTDSIRLVRHGNKELPVLDTFHLDRKRFEAYQAFQKPNRFADSKYICVFAPWHGTGALFLGLWTITSCTAHEAVSDKTWALVDTFGFPQTWKTRSVFYDLRLHRLTAEMSERLVIEWGSGTLSWVQRSDKEILEIRRRHSIGEFSSYSEVNLTMFELKRLMADPGANLVWKNALSSVHGIYLIRDKSDGRLYVGAAYGNESIYGRWQNYANSGHGGDVMLKKLDHSNFEFSILEIAPRTATSTEVIGIEERWKKKLGTRQFGHLNSGEGRKPTRA